MQNFGVNLVQKWERGGEKEVRLLQLESQYIISFKSMIPHGINQNGELHVHL